jgi:hypothetical protein
MQESGIAGTAPQRHFLLVEVDREEMRITPLSYEPLVVRDANRNPVAMPLIISQE